MFSHMLEIEDEAADMLGTIFYASCVSALQTEYESYWHLTLLLSTWDPAAFERVLMTWESWTSELESSNETTFFRHFKRSLVQTKNLYPSSGSNLLHNLFEALIDVPTNSMNSANRQLKHCLRDHLQERLGILEHNGFRIFMSNLPQTQGKQYSLARCIRHSSCTTGGVSQTAGSSIKLQCIPKSKHPL